MKGRLIVLLLFMAFIAYGAKKTENIEITVNVKKNPEMGLTIIYLDVLKGFEFDKKGYARRVIEDMDVLYFSIQNGFSERRAYYAERGDRLNFAFDGESMAKSLVITGGYDRIQKYLNKVKIIFPGNQDFALDFKDYMKVIQEKTDSSLMLLNASKSELSKDSEKFVKIEQSRIKYMILLSMLNYPQRHAWVTEQKEEYQAGPEYYTEIEKWMKAGQDPSLLDIAEYQKFMADGSAVLAGYEKKSKDIYPKVLAQVKYIGAHVENDRVRQCLINRLVSVYVGTYGLANVAELENLYKKHVIAPDLKARYAKVRGKWEMVAAGQSAPDFQAVDSMGKIYTLKDFRGKNVCLYLCMNASPCLNEYQYLKKMQPIFDKMNIQLVNLSIDSKAEEWGNYRRDKNTQLGTHLYLGHNKVFLEACCYNSYQMYQFILIDKEGKIINIDILRPSSQKLEDYLETLNIN